jgi:hypothetical protein
MRIATLLVMVLALGTALGSVASVQSQASPDIIVDSQASNGTVSGAVVSPGPSKAVVEVKNLQHFWKGVAIFSETNGADAQPASISADPRNVYAWIGVLAPNASTTFEVEFPANSSVTILVNYDLISAGGSVALGMTVLNMLADLWGAKLKLSLGGFQLAMQALNEVPQWIAVIEAAREGGTFGLSRSLLELLSSESGSAALVAALGHLGVLVDATELKKLASPLGLWSFGETVVALATALAQGSNTAGSITFSHRPPATPTPTNAPPIPTPTIPPPTPTKQPSATEPSSGGLHPLVKAELISQMPIQTQNFAIEYLTTSDSFIITVYECPVSENKEAALQWFRDQGVDPNSLTILYNIYRYLAGC